MIRKSVVIGLVARSAPRPLCPKSRFRQSKYGNDVFILGLHRCSIRRAPIQLGFRQPDRQRALPLHRYRRALLDGRIPSAISAPSAHATAAHSAAAATHSARHLPPAAPGSAISAIALTLVTVT